MKLKKGLLALLGSYLAAGLLVAVTAAMLVGSAPGGVYGGLSENLTASDAAAVNNPVSERYMLRETDGIIGIFLSDGRLCDKIEVPVVTLPVTERERLAAGVTVDSYEKLLSLIEDYTG